MPNMTKQRLFPRQGIQRMVLDNKGDRSLDRLSKDCGGRPSAAGLQKMTTNELKAFPDVETIQGLSRGLNVPVRDVLLACARSVGLDIGSDSDDVLPIVGGKRLPRDSQDVLLRMSRILTEAMEAMNAYEAASARSEFAPAHSYDLAARHGDSHIAPDQLPE